MNKNQFPKGSEWRKWDLHCHTKGTLKNNQFKSKSFAEFSTIFFRKALDNEIAAIGITDYFSIDNYKEIIKFVNNIDSCSDFNVEEKEQIKQIFILPNVELRMLPVTDSSRLVNIHCLFNPNYVDSLENDFFGSIECSAGSGKKYKMNRQGLIDLGKSLNSDLDKIKAYEKGAESFFVSHLDLEKLLKENRDFKENVIIAVSNSNIDGASAFQQHYDLFEECDAGSLDAVRKSIYCISDCIFSSNEEDIKYFLGLKKDKSEVVKEKCGSLKPCIHGSDAHIEEKLFKPDKQRYCWIKADTTFEGLKQIIYEPESGERVKICPIEPDQKEGYKTIAKIRFRGTDDFPEEIILNRNLCSIIGSRSSGKSALLAYLAHSVDKELTEYLIPGPGEGTDYRWNKIQIEHSIEWSNSKSNGESPGKIVYIPQNHLFKESKNSNEVKEKIKPILFRYFPQFRIKYEQTINNIESFNQKISDHINNWYELSDSLKLADEQLKELGDKDAIIEAKKEIVLKIKILKDKDKLSEKELEQYQKINADLLRDTSKIDKIDTELLQLSDVSNDQSFFNELKITLSPALVNLSKGLQDKISEFLKKKENEILKEVNVLVREYKKDSEESKLNFEGAILKIKEKNRDLIEKYQKNIELERYVQNLNQDEERIDKINKIIEEKNLFQNNINKCEGVIKAAIDQKNTLLKELADHLDNTDQSTLETITFGVEYNFDKSLEQVTQKINIKERSNFIDYGILNISKIREKPDEFLSALYSGEQKIIKGYEEKQVAKEILTLTEKILFNAKMEDDIIGGFSEPTMTPGKRALFLLRLILFESEDTWPLLIDQPEDDLDSRSIYDSIVPFLKEKKKERQIIMVSHNANLVIGADSEQIIVANRHGTDRKNDDERQFNYLTGSLEFSEALDEKCTDTLKSQGICEHACEILEGGKIAFEQRKNKYNIR